MTNTKPSAGHHTAEAHAHGVCPWYLGYFLASPIRRLFERPEALLAPFVRPGMVVLEPGCGMGYFTLPMARLVGPTGRVVCVDLQPQMLAALRRRARRAGLSDRIETTTCGPDDLGVSGWAGRVDLAVAIHMLHEVPDVDRLLRQLHEVLRPGGTLFIREPRGHVTDAAFEATITKAEAAGFGRSEPLPPPERLEAVLTRA
jgi:ubiquinone/menaquinone biosynthesis C-methylase UbiE